MIVRPDAISASRAPSTNPLNSCDTKLGQLTTRNLTQAVCLPSAGSMVVAQFATERVGLLHQRLAGHDFDNLPEIFLILHGARALAAHNDDWSDQLMILLAEMHVAYGRGEGFALLVLLDDIGGIE